MDIGETVGNYRLLSVLGRGGMGVVYRAEHLLLGRVAALKVLLPEFSANQDVVTRFFNEAKAATLIHHPGIVQIWDYGQHHDGSAYLVMELVDGTSLAAHLRAVGKLTQDQAIPIAIDIAAALAAAHAAGIVHRDLKPDNIILVDDPAKAATRTKILDFGIAKLGADLLGGSLRTRTGSLLGTPMYMAPEQCRGASDLDSRADIYSLSCIVFEMLTGQPPFARGALAEILAAHLYEEPPSIRASNPEIAVELDTLIRSGMAKAAEARPPAMTALELQLRASLVGRPGLTTTLGTASVQLVAPPRRAARWPLAAGALGVIATVVVAIAMTRGSSEPAPAPVSQPAAPPAPISVPPPPPPPAPTAPRPAPTITLSIESVPAGADVFRAFDGVLLGTTPVAIAVDRAAGQARLIVRKRGYRDGSATLSTLEDGAAKVVLERAQAPRPTTKATPAKVPVGDGAADPFGD